MENCDNDDDKSSSSGGGGGSGGSVKKVSLLGAEKSVRCSRNTHLLLTIAVSLIIFNAGLSNIRSQDILLRFLQVLIFIKRYCREFYCKIHKEIPQNSSQRATLHA